MECDARSDPLAPFLLHAPSPVSFLAPWSPLVPNPLIDFSLQSGAEVGQAPTWMQSFRNAFLTNWMCVMDRPGLSLLLG